MKKILNKYVIALLFIIALCVAIFFYKENFKSTKCNYSVKDSYNLDTQNKEYGYKLLKQDMKKNDICLSLLDYNIEENYKINLDISKYLNKNCGIKNYITDLQYGEAVIINEYLNTGNEEILKELFDKNCYPETFNGSFYEYLKSLYAYNKTLSANNKIKIYGLNADIEFKSSTLAFKYILPKDTAPESINFYINALKNNLNNISDNTTYITFMLTLEDNLKKNKSAYEKYLGKNFFDFKNICDNLIDTAKYLDKHPSLENVNSFVATEMQKNFNTIYSKNKDKKYYGFFKPEYFYNSDDSFTIHSILSNKNPNIKNKYIIIKYFDNKLAVSKNVDNSLIKYNKTFIKTNNSNSSLGNYIVYVKDASPVAALCMTSNEKKRICSYLNKNKVSLGNNEKLNFDNAKLLNNDLSKYDIFFTGEVHAVKINSNISLSFLKYLNKNAGVKYFLCEDPYSQGQLINKFLKTGDKSILNNIFSSLSGTAAYNNQTVEKWVDLYEYNKTLKEDKKIVVVGIDVEHQSNLALQYVQSLIPDSPPPTQISEDIKQLKVLSLQDFKKADFIEKLNKSSNLYKNYLGENYFDFKFVIENISNALNYYSKNDNSIREKAIYNNFIKVYNHLPKGKYYGQWGGAHIDLSCGSEAKEISSETMATMINGKSSPLQRKVLSIPIDYINSSMLQDNNDEKISPRYNMSSFFTLLSEDEVTLFKLDGDFSPFKEKNYVVPNTSKGVTTDYFQYILLVRNSPAADKFTEIK